MLYSVFFSKYIALATGGYSQKNWVGVCDLLPKTLTLFVTRICHFSYPFYNLTRNLKFFL